MHCLPSLSLLHYTEGLLLVSFFLIAQLMSLAYIPFSAFFHSALYSFHLYYSPVLSPDQLAIISTIMQHQALCDPLVIAVIISNSCSCNCVVLIVLIVIQRILLCKMRSSKKNMTYVYIQLGQVVLLFYQILIIFSEQVNLPRFIVSPNEV